VSGLAHVLSISGYHRGASQQEDAGGSMSLENRDFMG